jgi:hypothetical protein
VKSNGGIYVIEDMYHSFLQGFNDTNETVIDVIHKLIMLKNDVVKENHPQFGTRITLSESETFSEAIRIAAKSIYSINCYFRACVLIKK